MDADWIRTDYKAVDKRDSVRQVQGWLLGESRNRPIVLDGKRPFGIPNKRAFMGGRLHENEKLDHFTLPTPILRDDTSHYEAIQAIQETLAPYLPVGGPDRLEGYVTALDLCAFLEDGPSGQDAAQPVAILSPRDTLDRAMRLFRNEVSDHLPVLDEQGRLSAMLDRAAVLRVQHERLVGMGRVDFQAERNSLLNDPVVGFAERAWSEAPAATPFGGLIEVLEREGYAFVPDMLDAATGQRTIGLVTPQTLARAAHRAHVEGWSFGRHGEGEVAQRKPYRIPETPVRPRQMNHH